MGININYKIVSGSYLSGCENFQFTPLKRFSLVNFFLLVLNQHHYDICYLYRIYCLSAIVLDALHIVFHLVVV